MLDDVSLAGGKDAVQRVLLCTGKIAYPLMEARTERSAPVAVVRVEQIYPLPTEQLLEIIKSYPNAREVMWVQEEPGNMGAWQFIHFKLIDELPEGTTLSVASRHESGSPATGSSTVHKQELEGLIDRSLTI